MFREDSLKEKEFEKYSFSLQEDIDKLIELGYRYFELEIIKVEEGSPKSEKREKR